VRSDQFNVYVLAERIEDVNHDGAFQPNEGDKIVAVAHTRTLLDRSKLIMEEDINKQKIQIIEKEN